MAVEIIKEVFSNGQTITGQTSGATATIQTVEEDTIVYKLTSGTLQANEIITSSNARDKAQTVRSDILKVFAGSFVFIEAGDSIEGVLSGATADVVARISDDNTFFLELENIVGSFTYEELKINGGSSILFATIGEFFAIDFYPWEATDTVFGSTSGASVVVDSYTYPNITGDGIGTGTFVAGEIISGESSNSLIASVSYPERSPITQRPRKRINGFLSKWNAAGGDLPIQYTIRNTRFPDNNEDSSYTFTSASNDNGYAKLVFGSVLGFQKNSWIKVNGSVYSGVFLVVSVDGTTGITINTSFKSTDSGNVIQYYNDYALNVEIYTGISSDHPNPVAFSLVDTIKINPKVNQSKINILNILKNSLNELNDFTGDIDYNPWTDFYIKYYETYEKVRGTTITSDTIDDSANVSRALNAALQFGYRYAGNLYEYVVGNGREAKWLTDFVEPTYFVGQPFDISLLVETDIFDLDITQYDENGNQLATQTESYSGGGYGVYRFELSELVTLNTNAAYMILSAGGVISFEDIRINIETLCQTQ